MVALISVVIAWLAMKDSRGLMRRLEILRAESAQQLEKMQTAMKDSEERLDTMHALVSTKYVASFPADMDAILETLSSAQREISILIDVAGYGHMSRHTMFKRYEQLLIHKKKVEKVDIRIAMYDMDSWGAITPRLFRPGDYDEQRARDPDLKEYVQQLKSSSRATEYWLDLEQRLKLASPPSSVADIKTYQDFIDRLRLDELHYRQNIPGIDIQLSSTTHLPMLCWMVDGKKAVYSFIFDRSDEGIRESRSCMPSLTSAITSTDPYERYQDTTYEITFMTADPSLLNVLKEVMWSYAPSLLIDGKTRAVVPQPRKMTEAGSIVGGAKTAPKSEAVARETASR
jgi:hypothetical protein